MAGAIQRCVQWVTVAGCWTRISVMGTDLSPSVTRIENSVDDSRTVILMIPGNPGNEGFYEHFGRELLRNIEASQGSVDSKRKYIFYTVSHLNHVEPPKEFRSDGKRCSCDRISLADQVLHKLDFCREHLPKAERIVVFGHSIGAYMMLRILPKLIEEGFNVIRAGALFPTIERMAESPSGRRLFGVLSLISSYDSTIRLFFGWVNYLPFSMKRYLFYFNFPTEGVPQCVYDSTAELVNIDVFRNIVYMSVDELQTVCKLDESLVKQYTERIRFYYGTKDNWCPIEYAMKMRGRLGEDAVTIDKDQCEHAFVISDSEVMARNVIDWAIE